MSSAPTNYKSALLPELVKAIKFAYPDYGVNKIHAHVVKTHLLDLKKEYDDDERRTTDADDGSTAWRGSAALRFTPDSGFS